MAQHGRVTLSKGTAQQRQSRVKRRPAIYALRGNGGVRFGRATARGTHDTRRCEGAAG